MNALAQAGLAWMDYAACRAFPPDMFYPARGLGHRGRIVGALAVCESCPVRGPCDRDTQDMPATQRQVGMIRGGRYYRTAKTAEDRTEGAT